MSSENTTPDTTEYAIEVNGLGKCYQIYDKPSDRLKQMLVRGRKQYYKEFWALKDVSFKIKKGETVGIIGRNGSGKSTLLQMICGTLNPTMGDIKIHGRVAALLELGAGFNPEFSGVENVYLAASLYGLDKHQVDQRYSQIVDFADIGEHIHQPVKTYSSGMFVRLAFAVIAHVDADVLVVDEALAVGDAVFTQKCMRYIRNFKKRGTLIFVSHDMGAILSLCERSIWLDSGMVVDIGTAESISKKYLAYTAQKTYGEAVNIKNIHFDEQENHDEEIRLMESKAEIRAEVSIKTNLENSEGWKTGLAEIDWVEISNLSQGKSLIFKGGELVRLTIEGVVHKDIANPIIGFLLRDRLGQDLFGENTVEFTKKNTVNLKKNDRYTACFEFLLPKLPNGQYSVMVSFAEGDQSSHVQHHWLHDALVINVASSEVRWGLVGINFSKIFIGAKK